MSRSCLSLLFAVAAVLVPLPVLAAIYVVDTTSDNAALTTCLQDEPGDCSLRGAIARANLSPGADTVEFDIPMSDPGCDAVTGTCRIVVNGGSAFSISQPLIIDGYTQPGAQPNTIPAPGANNAQLKIEVTPDPPICPSCVHFQTSNTSFEVRGLSLFHGQGSWFNAANSRLTVRGIWVGVTADGAVPDFAGAGAIFRVLQAHAALIGGPDPADRNVLAGAGRDLDGLPGGGFNDVATAFGATPAPEILVQGNLIGLQPDGISPLPFRDPFLVGVSSTSADIRILDNRVVRPPRNFSGGFGGALSVSTSVVMSQRGFIQGNVFGLGVDGSRIGVEREHVLVSNGNSTTRLRLLVGGMGSGDGNTFAAGMRFPGGGFSGSAVAPSFTADNSFIEFVGNTMLGNAGLGLDLPTVGQRLLNDPGDADTGLNNLQNHPKVSAFSVDGDHFEVTYLVDSHPDHSAYPLRVDFYRALGDEGEVLLDSDVYEAVSAQQSKSVTLPIPPGVSLSAQDVLVAVATDFEGRSSEFSFDLLGSLTGSAPPGPNYDVYDLPVTVTAQAGTGPFAPNGVVEFRLNTGFSNVPTCTAMLAASAVALTSSGSCPLPAPLPTGAFTVTARYVSMAGAFASASGGDVTTSFPVTITPDRIFTHDFED